LITEIASALVLLAPLFSNTFAEMSLLPSEGQKNLIEAQLTLRRHAAELDARNRMIPWYGLFAILRLVPRRAKVQEASRLLMRISNSVAPRDPEAIQRNLLWRNQIQELLGLMKSAIP
jgi:hypothetical protein